MGRSCLSHRPFGHLKEKLALEILATQQHAFLSASECPHDKAGEVCRSMLSIQTLPNRISFAFPWGDVREITENYIAHGNYYLQH